ncbi:hypothetical protein PS691_04389 [Pseudomonas fluorescens]|uniref:Uncharacterized protein n=1 Tax=Pseudomonas fluorescens TaxID=294 RepID=A0A5E7EAQ8_PSEFL|nr:hypothetical protein PS691_04389 [Pseudomonas fluorescens]
MGVRTVKSGPRKAGSQYLGGLGHRCSETWAYNPDNELIMDKNTEGGRLAAFVVGRIRFKSRLLPDRP